MTWLALTALLLQSVDYQTEGIKALDARQYASAVELFQKAVAADAQDYGAHFHLALAYSLLNRDTDAIPEYNRVLELKPTLYEAELNLGICLLRTRNIGEAAVHLKSALDQKPKEPRPAYYYAQALLDSGGDAESAFANAAGLNPQSAPAESGWAQALLRAGKLEEAEPHFRKAAALDPSYKSAVLQLGELYERKQNYPAAIAIYREFPENPGAQERAAALLMQTGKIAESIPAFEAAVAKSPTPANRVALAEAYLANKEPAKATPLLEAALKSDPNDFELHMFCGRVYRDQRQFAQAAANFFRATQLKPDSERAWSELAGVMIATEQYSQALTALDRARRNGWSNPSFYYFHALCFDHLHQIKEALADYNKFLDLSQGKFPDEEFKARQRARIISSELNKK